MRIQTHLFPVYVKAKQMQFLISAKHNALEQTPHWLIAFFLNFRPPKTNFKALHNTKIFPANDIDGLPRWDFVEFLAKYLVINATDSNTIRNEFCCAMSTSAMKIHFFETTHLKRPKRAEYFTQLSSQTNAPEWARAHGKFWHEYRRSIRSAHHSAHKSQIYTHSLNRQSVTQTYSERQRQEATARA